MIRAAVKDTPQYRASVSVMEENYRQLLGYFQERSTPFFPALPGAYAVGQHSPVLAGYFVGMLHNPNNVTIQASTSTTLLEMLVMRDLCHMVGWPTEQDDQAWAHIAADGSIVHGVPGHSLPGSRQEHT